MKIFLVSAFSISAFLLGGCVSNPGVVQLSPDTYLIARTDRAGIFGNTAAMKVSVIREASEFAASKGKVAIPLATNETPVYPGHCATIEYQFRVVDKDDPEAVRTSLVPRADIVIEKSEKISADVHTKDESDKKTDLYSEIMKLDDLRKKGLITDAEYNSEKQKLLNRTK